MKPRSCLIVLSAWLAGAGTTLYAQDGARNYPNKPVRVIIPYPPGEAADFIARVIGPTPPGMGAEDFGGSIPATRDGQFYIQAGKTAFINLKVLAALKNQLRPILCVGESLGEREAGTTLKVVQTQLEAGLEELRDADADDQAAADPLLDEPHRPRGDP